MREGLIGTYLCLLKNWLLKDSEWGEVIFGVMPTGQSPSFDDNFKHLVTPLVKLRTKQNDTNIGKRFVRKEGRWQVRIVRCILYVCENVREST